MQVLTEVAQPAILGWHCEGWDDATEDACGAWRLTRADAPDVVPCWRCGDE
jgi:hypothetical protein